MNRTLEQLQCGWEPQGPSVSLLDFYIPLPYSQVGIFFAFLIEQSLLSIDLCNWL
jgi:hypothetical protein